MNSPHPPDSCPIVSVFCQEHEKPWLVDEFTRFDGNWFAGTSGPPGTWVRGNPFSKPLRGSADGDRFGFVDSVGNWDRWGERTVRPKPGWSNAHHNLKCLLCAKKSRKDNDVKLTNVSAGQEKLAQIFNVLVANGVSEISLSALAARL
jgi:hypothetical protein